MDDYANSEGILYIWNKARSMFANHTEVPKIEFDTKANWDAQTLLVSVKNTIYVYTDYKDSDGQDIAGIKIGDGLAYVIDLPFIDKIYADHVSDTDIHITSAERTLWNNKDRAYYAGNETLVLTKN